MNLLFIFSLTVLTLFPFDHTVIESSKTANPIKRYTIETGIIEYEYTGVQTGTETLYFDQWGMREAKYKNTEMDMMGFKQKENKVEIMKDGYIYSFTPGAKTGTKMEVPFLNELTKNNDDLGEVGLEILKQMGGKKIGTGEVAGKSCDIWEIESVGTKAWVWNAITLKAEINMMGMTVNMTAKSIKANASVQEEKMKIPDGITFTESQSLEEIMKMMNLGK